MGTVDKEAAPAAENGAWLLFGGLFIFLVAARFCHVDVLWVDESYGMAAAQAMLAGKRLYSDLWFDKPPLYAWFYLLEGGLPGWPLRLAGALYALLCCWLSYGTARALFGWWEGRLAALGMAFFLVFGMPSSVVSIAPDLLTIPFALGMAWLAATQRPLLAGLVAGLALLANAKALFLLPVVGFWLWPQWPRVLGGYLLGAATGPLLLAAQGSLGDYWQQVWVWGAVYSRDTPIEHPLAEGVHRTANWIGFHAALVLPTVVYFLRRLDAQARPLSIWFLLALASVAGGWRFYPRYYFAVLPVAVLLAAHGWRLVPSRWQVALLAISLAIPAIRFGKPQAELGWQAVSGIEATHRDLALGAGAREAAMQIRSHAAPGDTLLVWGYRPELNVLAGLPPGTRFLDSQPLTGVIADRHLVSSRQSYPALSASHRKALLQNEPTWIADGLGLLNPALAITSYAELTGWLEAYEHVYSNSSVVLYKRRDGR